MKLFKLFKFILITLLRKYKKMLMKDEEVTRMECDMAWLSKEQSEVALSIKKGNPNKIENVDKMISEISGYEKYS